MIRAVLFAIATVATLVAFSREQIRQAWINLPRILLCTAHKRRHANNEQLAQVLVAHLGDAPEPFLATTRLLKWRQSQPGRELSPRAELMRVGDRCGQGRRADRPDTGDRHEPTCDIVAALPDQQIAIDRTKPNMDPERLL